MKPKILPIVYVMIFAALMYVMASMIGSPKIELDNRSLISIIVFMFGVLIVLVGGYQFRKASTTVNPLLPEESSKLVTSGIYRYSRNPMYIGFFLFLLAWSILLGSLVTLLVLPIFVLLITKVQIVPEEAILEEKFQNEYRQYKSNVRRWI